jgi:hypothetical protein
MDISRYIWYNHCEYASEWEITVKIATIAILLLATAPLLNGCDSRKPNVGYGRYTLRIDLDTVKTTEGVFTITRQGTELVLGGHSLTRGVYRKTRPWLYVHRIGEEEVDVTFDEGSKVVYPLYTGSLTAIFNPYLRPCDVTQSTCVMFKDGRWLVLHTWTEDGILADLLQQGKSNEEWTLVRGDIYIPGDGTEVNVVQLRAKVKCTAFDLDGQTATVVFTAKPVVNR